MTGRVTDRIVELYAGGLSTRAVAAQLGLAKTTVLAALKKKGVPLRPRGGDRRSR